MYYSLFEGVLEQYEDTKNSIDCYFDCINSQSIFVEKFAFCKIDEIKTARLDELEKISSLVLLASIEAMLQNDYKKRVKKRARDTISQKVRENYKNVKRRNPSRVTLSDIFPVLKDSLMGSNRQCIINIETAFRYRHWLAHGQYWTWKHGVIPSFHEISILAQTLSGILLSH